jgi:hypothetical protein
MTWLAAVSPHTVTYRLRAGTVKRFLVARCEGVTNGMSGQRQHVIRLRRAFGSARLGRLGVSGRAVIAASP